jgi:hypothetical protein
MPDLESQIRARIDAFVTDINDLVRQAALEVVNDALLGGPRGARARGRGARRGRRAQAGYAEVPQLATGAPARARRKGERRTPEELAATLERLATYITQNPGQGIEAIGKGMNTPTRELTLPIRKLLADKRIRKRGQKRSTKYYPN